MLHRPVSTIWKRCFLSHWKMCAIPSLNYYGHIYRLNQFHPFNWVMFFIYLPPPLHITYNLCYFHCSYFKQPGFTEITKNRDRRTIDNVEVCHRDNCVSSYWLMLPKAIFTHSLVRSFSRRQLFHIFYMVLFRLSFGTGFLNFPEIVFFVELENFLSRHKSYHPLNILKCSRIFHKSTKYNEKLMCTHSMG